MTYDDYDILARTIYGEARGEDDDGKHAVAWTIRNRMVRDPWPDSVKGVCLQPMQFSCWNTPEQTGQPWIRTVKFSDRTLQVCMWAGMGVMLGKVDDPTGGADHYMTLARYREVQDDRSHWVHKLNETCVIGAHVFFK